MREVANGEKQVACDSAAIDLRVLLDFNHDWAAPSDGNNQTTFDEGPGLLDHSPSFVRLTPFPMVSEHQAVRNPVQLTALPRARTQCDPVKSADQRKQMLNSSRVSARGIDHDRR